MEQENQTNSQESFQSQVDSMAPNVAGALSYIFPPFSGVLFYVMDSNKQVKFHAFQSMLIGFAAYFIYGILNFFLFLSFGVFGNLLRFVLNTAFIAGWLFLIWKTYKNEAFEIPFISKIARQQTQ